MLADLAALVAQVCAGVGGALLGWRIASALVGSVPDRFER